MSAPEAARRERIEYFGAGGALLGCFTDALTGEARDTAVVIAQPIGHEYVRCHRALRRLALHLASHGFPVFRFDWFGAGDSLGDLADADPERWIDDLGDAIRECGDLARAGRTAIIGMRFGATIAALAPDVLGPVDFMALWDPVVRGDQGLAPMRADHARHERERGLAPGATRLPDGGEDIFGYAYPPGLLRALEGLDLLRVDRPPAARVLVVDQEESRPGEALAAHLASLGACEYWHEARPPVWMAEPHTGLVPREAIERIAAWLASCDEEAEAG